MRSCKQRYNACVFLCRLDHAHVSCHIPNEAHEGNTSPATAAMQQPHASVHSALSAKATMLFAWYNQFQEHLFGRGKITELKKDLLAKPHSALDPAQRGNTVTAEAAHPSAKDATSATPALHWREYEQQDSAQSMQQSTMNRAQQADLWPQYQLQGYPWPCMQIARRSALRWHVKWHGFVWPQKKELLVNLDYHY